MNGTIKYFEKWWPVFLRGGLWVLAATIPVALANLKTITPEKLKLMTWIDWLIVALEVGLAAVIALRTYLDSSLQAHKDQLQATGDIASPPVKTVIAVEPVAPVKIAPTIAVPTVTIPPLQT